MSRDDSSARALLAALHEAALRADHLCEEGGADNGGQLQQAIENGEALWQQIHAGSRWASLPGASRAQALADAAAVLSVRATVTDDTSDILSALQLGESALALASHHAPELVAGLHAELAAIARQLPTGRYGDRVLEHSRLAAEQTPDGDPRRPLRLSNLGAVWRGRYVQSGDAEDLDRAITCFLAAREESGSPSGMIEHNLAVGLSDRYDRTSDPADLAAALDAAGRAVGATPRGSPDRPDSWPSLRCACESAMTPPDHSPTWTAPSPSAPRRWTGSSPGPPRGPGCTATSACCISIATSDRTTPGISTVRSSWPGPPSTRLPQPTRSGRDSATTSRTRCACASSGSSAAGANRSPTRTSIWPTSSRRSACTAAPSASRAPPRATPPHSCRILAMRCWIAAPCTNCRVTWKRPTPRSPKPWRPTRKRSRPRPAPRRTAQAG